MGEHADLSDEVRLDHRNSMCSFTFGAFLIAEDAEGQYSDADRTVFPHDRHQLFVLAYRVGVEFDRVDSTGARRQQSRPFGLQLVTTPGSKDHRTAGGQPFRDFHADFAAASQQQDSTSRQLLRTRSHGFSVLDYRRAMSTTPDALSDLALEFVRERHLATLTTLRRDGTPHVVAVGFTWDSENGKARVITSGGSQKALNAERGGYAAVSQVDGARWITFEGPARVLADPASVADAEERYAGRYRQPRVNPKRVVIEIDVTKVLGSSRL